MPSGQRINIIYSDNGRGLSRDAVIIRDALRLAGYRPSFTPLAPGRFPRSLNFAPERIRWAFRGVTRRAMHAWATRSKLWDINIFLETLVPDYFPSARVNCFIPNQEWLSSDTRMLMRDVDLVLFKTEHAMRALSSHARASAFLGFTSLDRRDSRVTACTDAALHVSGWNPHKGTGAVVAAWTQHPEWPGVTVISQHDMLQPRPANVDLFSAGVPDKTLRRLQNATGLHVCPSEVEGFGHTLMEGMSCGAVIVTTDAPPMNELVSSAEGFLVPYASTEPMGSGTRYLVDRGRLAETIDHVWNLDKAHFRRLGEAARAKYEAGRVIFETQLARVLREL